eukprot:217924-Alexandrium_andersonii.AAC.1
MARSLALIGRTWRASIAWMLGCSCCLLRVDSRSSSSSCTDAFAAAACCTLIHVLCLRGGLPPVRPRGG